MTQVPELLIRPSLNDHKVIADLLAPIRFPGRRPISRLVLNAPDVVRKQELSEVAARSGTPLIIDPLTTLLQSEVDADDAWVKHVPFGRTERIDAAEFANPFRLDSLVAEVVEFQVTNGASAIVPPYFYADRPDSPALDASIAAIGRTARRMRADGISLPIIPILCGQLRGLARRPGWQSTFDRYAAAAVDVGPQAIGLHLSPVGDGTESYAKLLDLLLAARHLRSVGVPVFAWRQGVYGPALVAAGIDGYECGMGIGERSDVRSFMNNRKPRTSEHRPYVPHGIYFPVFGRSLRPRVAKLLLDDRRLRGRLICDSVRCCPRGAESMQSSKGRPHAVRARARQLQELADIPHTAWRLHHIAKQAASAHVLALKGNEVLALAGLPDRIKTDGYAALEQAADLLRSQDAHGARDTA